MLNPLQTSSDILSLGFGLAGKVQEGKMVVSRGLLLIALSSMFVSSAQGLNCWVCHRARNNRECSARGYVQRCKAFEGCENEIRYFKKRISITKRCKQLEACSNDQLQNSKKTNNVYQCSAQTQNSVCRCCCSTELCNKNQLSCVAKGQPRCRYLFLPNGSTKCTGSMTGVSLGTKCSFHCKTGYERRGASAVQCQRRGSVAEWSSPVPKCERKPACVRLYGHSISNGFVRCSGMYGLPTLGTSCVFRCNPRYFMVNENKRKTASNYEKTVCAIAKTSRVPTWTRKPPNCIEEMCPMISRILNGLVRCSNVNKLGSICKFSCNKGYRIFGANELQCQQTMAGKLWNDRQPTCQPLPCETLSPKSPLLNMKCTDYNKFGSICSFKCIEGYYLADPGTKTAVNLYTTSCALSDVDVDWSQPIPICLPKQCLDLENPDNGIFKCTRKFDFNSRCTFACTSPIYEISGEKSVVCLDDGQMGNKNGLWSYPPASCVLKKCPVINSEVTEVRCNDGLTFGSSCSLSCKKGYFPVESDGLTISETDAPVKTECILKIDQVAWSNPPPRCEKKRCPDVTEPEYGVMECSNGVYYGSTCAFSCVPGFELNGIAKSKCTEVSNRQIFGKWSKKTPSCKRKSCPTLYSVLTTRNITCTDNEKYESVCTVQCNTGYYMRSIDKGHILDRAKTMCGLVGRETAWSHRIPSCQPKACKPIGEIEHGSTKCSKELIYNAECAFTCDPGYELVGKSTIFCDDDNEISSEGKWSWPVPTCKPKKCDLLNFEMRTARIRCNKGRDFTSQCKLSCKPRHFIYDPETGTSTHTNNFGCTLDEDKKGVIWSPATKQCIPVSCAAIPDSVMYSTCTNGNKTGSRCVFSCPVGYDLVGNGTSRCRPTGPNNAKWTHPIPYCKVRSCSELVNDEDTSKNCSDESNYKSECDFMCRSNRGLFMTVHGGRTIVKSGVSKVQCDIDKRGKLYWTGELPKCNVKYCLAMRKIKNGKIKCSDGYKYQSTCTFSCLRGYKLSGSSSITCLEGKFNYPQGIWTDSKPSCTR